MLLNMTDKTLLCKKGNHVSGEGYSHVIMNQIIREDLTSVFLITAADSSLAFRMTLNVHLIMMPFPPIVILNGGKNALWKRREMDM